MNPESRVCYFTGYSPEKLKAINEDIQLNLLNDLITDEIEKAVKSGYTHLISDNVWDLDKVCFDVAGDLKNKYPNMTLESPNHCDKRSLYKQAKDVELNNLSDNYDIEYNPSNSYIKDHSYKNSRHMVDNSEMVIAIFDGIQGETMQIINYAFLTRKKVVFINPSILEVINI